jgi:hypothetical protein
MLKASKGKGTSHPNEKYRMARGLLIHTLVELLDC